MTSLPLLLPTQTLSSQKANSKVKEWAPSKYLQAPQPPPIDDAKLQDLEMAAARQMMDGKAMKKTRPRRTVDYGGPMGRWALLRKLQPNPRYVPYLRPSPPYIIDLLPPKAYPDNPSTSLCTKFVHTSTNKVRCPVNVVVWTPEARRVLTGSTSGEFTLWNGLTFNFETILQAHDSAIRAMRFTHSGVYLASADQSGIIKYFQPNMNNLTAWQGHREAIRGLSFSPNDDRFATASDDSTVCIWSFEESRKERTLTGHGWDVKCVEWHPTKGLLVSGSKDNVIKFWDPRTGTSLTTLHQHKNTIQALAWSPNGNFVASASRDQTVRVFDIRAMKEFCVLRGHKKEVCSVAWHPVHPLLVTGGSEGSLLHWDLSIPTPTPIFSTSPSLSSNQVSTSPSTSTLPAPSTTLPTTISTPRATLSQAHDSNVWSLAFHPLGHLLVSASNDHTTRFWSRERPGDASSVFSGGGEKPPNVMDLSGQEGDDMDGFDGFDEDDAFVPGIGTGDGPPGMGNTGGGGGWWNREDEGGGMGDRGAGRDGYGDSRNGNSGMGSGGGYGSSAGYGSNMGAGPSGYGSGGGGYSSGPGPSFDARGNDNDDDDDDFIPGFGAASSMGPGGGDSTVRKRQSGPLPPQEAIFSGGGGGGSQGDGGFGSGHGGYDERDSRDSRDRDGRDGGWGGGSRRGGRGGKSRWSGKKGRY